MVPTCGTSVCGSRESDVKKPRIAAIGAQTVCELAVCEDGYDWSFYPAWDPIPKGDLHQKGRDDELRAMQDYGVYVEIPIREAVGGKHIRGFPIAHMKGDRVRWRFVATEVNTVT